MGLARAAVHLLMTEASRRPFHGSVVTLGRQHVYVTAQETISMAAEHGVRLVPIPPELHREPTLAKRGFVSDDWLFQSLGFVEIVRIDYSDYESSEVILDLNSTETPHELQNRFDLVLDSGTLEHVFDFAAGLRHCVRMVRSGGRVIHLTPSSNCVEHGFFSVSPTLYTDFYAASGFEVNRVWLCEIPIDLPRGVWQAYDYAKASERFISLGQLSGKIWFSFSVATAAQSVTPRIPQQWIYTQTWSNAASGATANTSDSSGNDSLSFEDGSRSQSLVKKLAGFPFLQSTAVGMIHRWRKWIHQTRVRNKKLPYPFVGKF